MLVCVCVYVTAVSIIVYCKVVAVCSFHIHLNSMNFNEMVQDDIVYKYNTIQYMHGAKNSVANSISKVCLFAV